MAFQIMADNMQNISAAQDGAMYDVFGGQQSYVIAGMANELAVTWLSSSLEIRIGTGMGVIRGRHLTNTSPATLTLQPNATGYVVIRYDHGNISLMSTSTVQNGNINNSQITPADLLIGEYTTNATGVYQFIDKRDVKTDMKGDTPRIYFETTQPVNPQSYNPGDIWIRRWVNSSDHDCYDYFVNLNRAQWVKMFAVDSWAKTLI